MSERHWAEPLTESERALIDYSLVGGTHESTRSWLAHVLRVHDARTAALTNALEAAMQYVDPKDREWIESLVRAEVHELRVDRPEETDTQPRGEG